jgi:putative ABC transport system permease protein
MGLSGLVSGIRMGEVALQPAVTLPVVLLAFSLSAAIGIFFGFYPASRAARLDPIQALRYE